MKIKCKCIPGMRAASESLKLQMPLIIKEFPEIKDCYPGTINLEFENPLLILTPDHRTNEIKWINNFSEKFDFLRVKLKLENKIEVYDAWLYIPHASKHRNNITIHELITKKININHDNICEIEINRNLIQIPYYSRTAYAVL